MSKLAHSNDETMDEIEKARCELCGEAMPDGEEMFKFHGYSSNCPKPPMPRDYGIDGVKKLFKDVTGVDVEVRVESGEFIVIDPEGQEFRSGLARKQ